MMQSKPNRFRAASLAASANLLARVGRKMTGAVCSVAIFCATLYVSSAWPAHAQETPPAAAPAPAADAPAAPAAPAAEAPAAAPADAAAAPAATPTPQQPDSTGTAANAGTGVDLTWPVPAKADAKTGLSTG